MGQTSRIVSRWLIALLALPLAGSLSLGVSAHHKIKVTKVKTKKKSAQANADASAEPDKVLYDRAVAAVKHSKYTEGRLEYQTLINTYPDSEYLAKAKLGVADSYYKEGGISNLTQAIDAYKSFIVFFPFLDEAAYAQMQVGMAHYKMMEKSDRDPSQAEAAEDEFQTFLLKYPQSPLRPKAEQDLRDVQEVLADGEFQIGKYYYNKPDYPAAAARLMEVSERYPLYSRSDDALWMLGDVYMRARQVSKNEDDKNHWADLAGRCYDRILRDYPLSPHAVVAKSRLTAMSMPVPSADPDAGKRMTQDQRYEKQHHEFVLLRFPKELIFSRPNVVSAARAGSPNLNPPDDVLSATDVLKQGAPGPQFDVTAAPAPAANSGDTADEDSTPVEAEPVDTSSDAAGNTAAAEIIAAPAAAPPAADASSNAGAGADTNASAAAPNPAPPTAPPETPLSPSPSMLSDAGPQNSTGAKAVIAPTTAPGSSPAASAPAGAAPAAQGAASQAASTPAAGSAKPASKKGSKSDPKTESSSKKKKGIHKAIPW